MNKPWHKSKTNLVQIPFIAGIACVMASPEIQGMICDGGNGKFVLVAQIVLTIVARNLGSNVKFRR